MAGCDPSGRAGKGTEDLSRQSGALLIYSFVWWYAKRLGIAGTDASCVFLWGAENRRNVRQLPEARRPL